jgi:hypothetical protein
MHWNLSDLLKQGNGLHGVAVMLLATFGTLDLRSGHQHLLSRPSQGVQLGVVKCHAGPDGLAVLHVQHKEF